MPRHTLSIYLQGFSSLALSQSLVCFWTSCELRRQDKISTGQCLQPLCRKTFKIVYYLRNVGSKILRALLKAEPFHSLLPSTSCRSCFHTLLKWLDQEYEFLRSHLPTRKTFFGDLRALTHYLYFESWDHLLTFTLEDLELEIPPNTS
jgi:hypothetical protein